MTDGNLPGADPQVCGKYGCPALEKEVRTAVLSFDHVNLIPGDSPSGELSERFLCGFFTGESSCEKLRPVPAFFQQVPFNRVENPAEKSFSVQMFHSLESVDLSDIDPDPDQRHERPPILMSPSEEGSILRIPE
jgi:hypothetical protein